jgi:AraC-like DNA-binding protein
MSRLQGLHAAAAQLARQSPEIIANPATAFALEQDLMQALTACIRSPESSEDTYGKRHHELIMRRFHTAIAERGMRPVYISELCLEIGVSDRTLRACCLEHLGVGPLHYLWLRRMQLAQRALSLADPRYATVTSIATEYGFWELGRFAVSYRKRFGEPPSATLNRLL